MQKIVLFDIDDVLFDTDYFIQSSLTKFRLYPDIKDVLINLSKTCTLGILSQGEIEFQKNKLIKTNIYNLFPKKHIHIVPRKDTELKKD